MLNMRCDMLLGDLFCSMKFFRKTIFKKDFKDYFRNPFFQKITRVFFDRPLHYFDDPSILIKNKIETSVTENMSALLKNIETNMKFPSDLKYAKFLCSLKTMNWWKKL